MLVCLDCGGEGAEPCSACGSERVMEATDSGAIIRIPATANMPCSRCGTSTETLHFRCFRRVVALGWIDRIHSRPGYFCSRCRRTLFFQWQGSTLVFGWWGVFAMLFRNPFAILVNFRALGRPPFNPEQFGAITLAGLAQAAEQGITVEELHQLGMYEQQPAPSRSDEVRAAWEDEEEIDPSQLDRITRRALKRAGRIK